MKTPHNPQKKLILFDFDGTLAHTLPSIAATIQRVFQECGDPVPALEDIEPVIGMPLAEMMQQLNPAMGQEEAERRVVQYRGWYDEVDATHTTLFPQVMETLEELRNRGFPLVVSSNKAQAILERSAARLGIDGLFDGIAGVLPEYPKKPDPGFFTRRIAEQTPEFSAIPPERVLIVGDAWPDLAFAANLGAASCYVTYGYGGEKECMPYGPRYVIAAFSELTHIL